jgi:plasmid maintenance system antidote protein VapI
MNSGAEQLRDWIKRSSLTQRQAADRFGWDEAQLSHLLAGRRNLGLASAIKIERMTGIPVEAWTSTEVDETETSTATPAVSPTRRGRQ